MSASTACRWLKVPRRLSCPEKRMGAPSSSKVAKARCSPVPQSNGSLPSPCASLRRPSSSFATLSFRVNPDGTCDSLSSSSRSFGSVTAVSTPRGARSGPPRYFHHHPPPPGGGPLSPSLPGGPRPAPRPPLPSPLHSAPSPPGGPPP